MTDPRLEGRTPSDGGPWITLWDEDVPHVVPGYGPRHILSLRCWCHPIIDLERYASLAVSHNVGH